MREEETAVGLLANKKAYNTLKATGCRLLNT
jgi:hypothetical protein